MDANAILENLAAKGPAISVGESLALLDVLCPAYSPTWLLPGTGGVTRVGPAIRALRAWRKSTKPSCNTRHYLRAYPGLTLAERRDMARRHRARWDVAGHALATLERLEDEKTGTGRMVDITGMSDGELDALLGM